MRKIPTYAANGARLRDYALESIERLLAIDAVVVRRHPRTRHICAAYFRPHGGANPLRTTCHAGQRYSYIARVSDAARAWQHKRLIQRQDLEALAGERISSPEQLDLYVRSIFRAVPLSCQIKNHPETAAPAATPPPAPARVVNIGDFKRRKRGAARPIEFDSQSRSVEPERKAA